MSFRQEKIEIKAEVEALIAKIGAGSADAVEMLVLLCGEQRFSTEIKSLLTEQKYKNNPIALYYLAYLIDEQNHKADILLRACLLSAGKELKINPFQSLLTLAEDDLPNIQVLMNITLCYQKGLGGVEKSPQNANRYYKAQARTIYQNVLLNKAGIETNLYEILSELDKIYKMVCQNHLELISKSLSKWNPRSDINVIVSILESVRRSGIASLLDEDGSRLEQSDFEPAKDLLEFRNQYKRILTGINNIAERTRNYLLQLKKELPQRKFMVASFSLTGHLIGFVEGRPNCVQFIEDVIKKFDQHTSDAEINDAVVSIRKDLVSKTPKDSRHGATTLFINEVSAKLVQCLLFTPVSEALSKLESCKSPSISIFRTQPKKELPPTSSSPTTPASPEYKRRRPDMSIVPKLVLGPAVTPESFSLTANKSVGLFQVVDARLQANEVKAVKEATVEPAKEKGGILRVNS